MTGIPNQKDQLLRERALRVIPGGMYGHGNGAMLPEGYPQFFERGQGCRIVDVDGNEYIDFMCGYGPNLLGLGHPKVEAAAAQQRRLGNCFNGPTPLMVELAELLVDTIGHADWAIFAKNGTDATTACVTIARSGTGKRKVLLAKGAYHGAAPWCTPSHAGVVEGDRAHFLYYDYNDLASVEAAVEQAGDDLAGILVSPFKHDAFADQELLDPEWARALRRICDERGAALMLDEVRAGFRLNFGGSWETVGVDPDLSAYSKAIGNGYPIAAILGSEHFREATVKIYLTGSFWYAAVPMAAAIATIQAVRDEDAIQRMVASGTVLREGLAAQAASHGFALRQTGPVQMPMVLFEDDGDWSKGRAWTAHAVQRGVYLHFFHNMFLCAAHGEDDLRQALERTDDAFAALRRDRGGA
jgi:glutamate-1-semialdehyde 2,1-aminomutase